MVSRGAREGARECFRVGAGLLDGRGALERDDEEGRELVGREVGRDDCVGRDMVGRDVVGREEVGREGVGRED